MKVSLGDWGESFYVSESGRFGVTDCNGDRVELDADQWRRVVTLLDVRLPAAPNPLDEEIEWVPRYTKLMAEQRRTSHQTAPGTTTFTTLKKD